MRLRLGREESQQHVGHLPGSSTTGIHGDRVGVFDHRLIHYQRAQNIYRNISLSLIISTPGLFLCEQTIKAEVFLNCQ